MVHLLMEIDTNKIVYKMELHLNAYEKVVLQEFEFLNHMKKQLT